MTIVQRCLESHDLYVTCPPKTWNIVPSEALRESEARRNLFGMQDRAWRRVRRSI